MSLEYKILWVDDNIEDLLDPDISTIKKDIEDYISNLGLIPSIITFEDIKSAKDELFKTNYDLILSDYNMDGGNGDILIKEIRNGRVYTEVLFYTAQTQIEEIAKSLFADRVSFHTLDSTDRNNQKFKNKIVWLINQTLKKLQELNAIRGLVMAETSRLDRIIEEILILYFESADDKKEELKQYILKKIKKSMKDNFSGDELKIASKTEVEIVKSRIFDASKKSRALMKLLELKEIKDISFVYEEYEKDVIKTRNYLAHAKSEIKDGIEYLIIEQKEGIEYKKLKHEDIVTLRKNILKYDDILNEIKERFD